MIHFDVTAAILDAIALFLFYKQKNLNDPPSRRFAALLWLGLGGACAGALSSLALNAPRAAGVTAVALSNTVFSLMHACLPGALFLYIRALTGDEGRSPLRSVLVLLPAALTIGLIISNPLTGAIFTCSPDALYAHGLLYRVPYASAGLYAALCFCIYLFRKRAISPRTRVVLPVALGIPIAASLIQHRLPGIMLESFGFSISFLILLFTIQNSGELVDGSTGLFNRAALRAYVDSQTRGGRGFSALIIVMENAPLLRHTFGIQCLIRITQSVSRFLAGCARKGAAVFSLGEEAFAVLMDDATDGVEHEALTAKILGRFVREWSLDHMETDIQIRNCLLRCPEDASDAEDILDCAEELRLTARLPPRNEILRAGDLNLVSRKREREVEEVILAALDARLVRILYQPAFSVAERRYAYAEALHVLLGENGYIQQREILRVAESAGIMQKMGSLVLDTVCSFLARNDMAKAGIDRVGVRLSGVQCMQSDLPRQILSLAEAHQVDPARICFEITETSAVHSPEILSDHMRRLTDAGCSFALDDYGSGYTDLNYIVDLPFSLIKLDKGLVRSGFESESGRIVLEGTIALIKRLDRKIVAEGVETAEQAAALAALGCEYLQGFHYAKPLTEERFLSLLGKV